MHVTVILCAADAMPVFDMIEYQMVKRNISNGWISRLIYRSLYVVLVAFVAISLPFFGDLLGFIGESAQPSLSALTRVLESGFSVGFRS